MRWCAWLSRFRFACRWSTAAVTSAPSTAITRLPCVTPNAACPPSQPKYLTDLSSGTVPFKANYDGTRQEPVVLPSRVPNLLVNGATGIAVGMATNIPPHNLGEVCRALLKLLADPEIKDYQLVANDAVKALTFQPAAN